MSISKIKLTSTGQRFVTIFISRGRDPLTGKQNTPYTERFPFKDSWTETKGMTEARKREGELIPLVKAGKAIPLKERKEQERQQKIEENNRYTVKRLADEFLQHKHNTLKVTSYEFYKKLINEFTEYVGSIYAEDVNRAVIKKYFNGICSENQLKIKTVEIRLKVIKQMFKYAVREEILVSNPIDTINTETLGVKSEQDTKPKTFSREEVQQIITITESEPIQWRAFIRLAIDTGCRLGELCGLKWSKVDFESHKITIDNNVQLVDGKFIDLPTKSGKARDIYVTPCVMEILKGYRVADLERCLLKNLPRTDYVFHTNDGTPLKRGCVEAHFSKMQKKYGIPGFRPHKLRHTCASLSITNGADVVSISQKLGHSNPSITLNVYSHATEESKKRATEVFADAIYQQA